MSKVLFVGEDCFVDPQELPEASLVEMKVDVDAIAVVEE
jgi:hypothetical protein